MSDIDLIPASGLSSAASLAPTDQVVASVNGESRRVPPGALLGWLGSDLISAIIEYASPLRPAGDWDPTSGAFPADADLGTFYTATKTGTVDGVTFTIGDWLLPLVADAATDTYADQWVKVGYSEIVKKADGRAFDTIADAVADDLLVATQSIFIAGRLYNLVPASTYTANGGTVIDLTGSNLQAKLADSEPITLDVFGVIRGDTSEAANNAAKINAADKAAASLGVPLHLGSGVVFFTGTLTKTTGWIGGGKGYWPVQPAARRGAAFQTIDEAPTQLVAFGTFSKDYTYPGVSSANASGATRTNPSARGAGWNDGEYRLLSWMNGDGTLKDFSIAILDTSKGCTSEGFRLLPDFGGTNGQSGYEDSTEARRSTANVDVGLWIEEGENNTYLDIATVGHWRMAGTHCAQINLGVGSAGGSYHVTMHRCQFQGYVSFAARGSDQYQVTAVSGNQITVPWSNDIALQDSSVWPYVRSAPAGSFIGTLLAQNITGVAQSGSDCIITLDATVTGVSVGDHIIPRATGGGDSHLHHYDCTYSGFHFSNGGMAHDGNTVTTPFAYPSRCFEKSGFRGVETKLINPAFQTTEEVIWHIHDARKIEMIGLEIETMTDVNAGSQACRLIGSANNTTHFANPAGFTRSLKIEPTFSIEEDYIDWGPNIDVSRATTFNGVGDVGFFESAVLTVPSYNGSVAFNGANLIPFSGGKAGIKKSGHPFQPDAFMYNDATDELEQSAPVVNQDRVRIVSVSGAASYVLVGGQAVEVQIADDAAAAVNLSGQAFSGQAAIAGNSLSRQHGFVAFRAASSASQCFKLAGTTFFSVQDNVVLTGTTGTDGDLTVSTQNGVLYVENRTGSQGAYLVTLSM